MSARMALAFSAATVGLGLSHAAALPPAPQLSVRLTPAAPDGPGRVASLNVVASEPLDGTAAGAPLLRMPLVVSNVETSANRLQGLSATDADGPIPLLAKDDAPGPKPYRHWTSSRAIVGALTVKYSVAITNAPNPRGAAPPFELRSDGGALSGLLGGFLVAPDSPEPMRLALSWALPQGGLGVSTLGVADQVSPEAKSPAQWEDTYVMGGAPGREPTRPAPDGFFGVWQGAPPFNAKALLGWTHRLYDYDLAFFRAKSAPYTVYLRPNLVNAGGGVEVARSFVGTYDAHTRPEAFRLTLAHEMVHTFVGSLDQPQGLDASWYSEGLAVFYERVLPLRAGMIDRASFLRDLNSTAGRYYTDALNTVPNSAIAARFWADTRVRVLPYDRGALYFAEVDAAVRKASAGRRSLDDLVMAMLARRRTGAPLTEADWIEVVTRQLGPPGRKQFDDMMAGKPIILPSDAFGPCFRRTVVPLRRYELGFTPDVLTEPDRVVRGLVVGSTAALAGLRNGDRILKPVPQDGVQADQHAVLSLQILRGATRLTISYLPRSQRVQSFQWVSKACLRRDAP